VVLEKDGKDQLDRSCEKLRGVMELRKRVISYKQQNEGRLTGLVTHWVGTTF